MSPEILRRDASVDKAKSKISPSKVLIVDDSAVLRRTLSKILEDDASIQIVGTASNGEEAVAEARRLRPDVIVLDVEMPKMDGLTALPELHRVSPGVKVLMASRLTLRNAEISVKALAAGAADYLAKPSSTGDGLSRVEFNRELLIKVQTLGEAARSARARSGRVRARIAERTASKAEGTGSPGSSTAIRHRPTGNDSPTSDTLKLRPTPVAFRPKVLAVGCSTGGPQALMRFLTDLTAWSIRLPIVITQHMPPMFTKILSQQIEAKCGLPSVEAEEGMRLENGKIYIAPGGNHLLIKAADGGLVTVLDDGPPVQFCKPAVDPMFESLAKAVGGKNILSVILTGMGSDGRNGSRSIVEQGGALIAQDEETSVVWGMPGAVANAGLCHSVVPIESIAAEVAKYAGFGSAVDRRNIA